MEVDAEPDAVILEYFQCCFVLEIQNEILMRYLAANQKFFFVFCCFSRRFSSKELSVT